MGLKNKDSLVQNLMNNLKDTLEKSEFTPSGFLQNDPLERIGSNIDLTDGFERYKELPVYMGSNIDGIDEYKEDKKDFKNWMEKYVYMQTNNKFNKGENMKCFAFNEELSEKPYKVYVCSVAGIDPEKINIRHVEKEPKEYFRCGFEIYTVDEHGNEESITFYSPQEHEITESASFRWRNGMLYLKIKTTYKEKQIDLEIEK